MQFHSNKFNALWMSASILTLGWCGVAHAQELASEADASSGEKKLDKVVITAERRDEIVPRLNYGHVSEQWATLFQNEALGDRIEARNIFSGQISWTHGDIVTTLYGTNLTDQHYVAAINSGARFAGPPRQFGARVMKTF